MNGDASGVVAGTGQDPGAGRASGGIKRSPTSLLDQIRARGRRAALELRRQLVESIGPLPGERTAASGPARSAAAEVGKSIQRDSFEPRG